MKRRKVISTTGIASVVTLAGCLSLAGGEPAMEVIADPPTNFSYSDIETEEDSGILVVQGTLENIGDERSRPPRVHGVFYSEDDVKLDESTYRPGAFENLDPGERVRFELFCFAEPDDVARYTLHFGGDTHEETTTETVEETTEEPPEQSSERFSDDWEDGQYTSDPKWNVSGSGGERGYVEVVSESSPDGGNHSISLVGNQGGSAQAYTHQDLQFDVEWLTEALFKPANITENNRFRIFLDADFSGVTNSIGVSIDVGFRDGPGDTDLITPEITGNLIQNSEPGIVIDWEEDRWYRLKCHHDGSGVYKLKLWDTEQSEPAEYQTQSVGEAAGTEGSKLAISQYVGRGQEHRTNVASISHTTFPSVNDL